MKVTMGSSFARKEWEKDVRALVRFAERADQTGVTAEEMCVRAEAHAVLKEWQEALRDYLRALELDAKSLRALRGKAESLCALARLEQEQPALSLGGDNATVL